MRRTTTLRTLLSALVVTGACVTAGSPPASAADDTPKTAHAPASAGVLAAMQRDFGLNRSEAKARLAEEKQATAIEEKARSAAGSGYAGSWFTPDDGRLTVALADRNKAAAVRATGAKVELVTHSARQLETSQKRLDALKAPAGVNSWHVDWKTNKVVVEVQAEQQGDNDVRRFLARARNAAPLTVRTVDHKPTTLAAGTVGGDPYYTGNVRCSIGFSVHGGFVTAGHCGGAGQSVSGWDGSYIGNFQGSSFPDNDYAWVNVGSGWWTVPVVLGWGTVSDQLVRGSAEAPIGASICRSGSTSHWHCGTVLAKNETVNYSQGAVHQMTKTNACAEPGDSGGSFISGDQAQGVTSGGWGNCSSGGETWYQPVNEILNRYGLTLHTA
ncbi:S1 family peptidase [Streptomyces sp. NBC_01304]|uniref:S1 family peptidase n=1 Tax=Streptomyces sp. NBC_01304 TaxID=2903818 RepID=UPI002E0EDBE0|nr:S1 family peptidase [Streptomyces sp. NBC_01304]